MDERRTHGPRHAAFFLILVAIAAFPAARAAAQEAQPPAPPPQAEPTPLPQAEPTPPPRVEEPPAGPPLSIPERIYVALKREAKRYAKDSVALVKAPLTWNKTEWERTAGSVLIVGGLMFADRDPPVGSSYGFQVSGAMLAAGLIFNHENLRETGRDAIEAGLLAYVLDTYVIKRAVGRERPFESNGRTVFVPGSSHDSFPSGHATEAFAVASVVAARSKSWPIPVLAYTAATLVALDRINDRAHFASDVVAGAFLGSAVGHFLVNRHGEEEKGFLSKAKASLQLVPIRHGLAARVVM